MINHPTSASGFFLRIAVILLFTFLFFRLAFLYRDRSKNIEVQNKKLKPLERAASVANTTVSLTSTSNTFSRVLDSDRSVLKAIWRNRNVSIPKVTMSWDEFLKLPSKINTMPTGKAENVRESFLSSLKMCTYDQLTRDQKNRTCKNVWSSQFLSTWHSREVKALCDESANSKVRCFDSPTPKSRFCIIENAMLDFRRMRRRKSESGQTGRSFEKGFLSADCNTFGEDSSVDDIGHIPLYSPSIQRGGCDYVFDTPVLLYSHENIRNSYTMLTDTLNIFTTLLLHDANSRKKLPSSARVGEDRIAREDVVLLNLDGLKKNPLFNDQLNQFFTPHLLLLKNVIKAQDLVPPGSNPSLSPRLCFKQLLLPPRPLLPITRHEYSHVLLSFNTSAGGKSGKVVEKAGGVDSCHSRPPPSPIYQQLNLRLRHALKEGEEKSRETVKILLLLRRHNATTLPRSSPLYYQQRTVANEGEVVQALRKLVDSHAPLARLVVQDAQQLSYEDLVSEMRGTSLLIALHSASMVAATLYLPIGTKHCCAILELSPLVSPPSKAYRGYAHLSRHLGVLYDQLDLPILTDETAGITSGGSGDGDLIAADLGGGKRVVAKGLRPRLAGKFKQLNGTGNSTLVPVDALINKTKLLLLQLIEDKNTSCVLPEITTAPFFF